jgi:hypothetical protein
LHLSYYIYYRVAHPAQARTLVRQVQSALKIETGIDGRLLTKRDDRSTWMEIYEGVEDGARFEQSLGAILQAAGFSTALAPGSARQMECFEEPCA